MHRDEIIAFTAAVFAGADMEADRVEALYVQNTDMAGRLLAPWSPAVSSQPQRSGPVLTVVAPSEDFAQCLSAGSPHRLVVPVPGSREADVVLEAVDSHRVTELMRSDEMGSRLAEKCGGLARMSLLMLRRRLVVQPELHRPEWADGPVGKTLRRCLLLHSWDQNNESDRQIVERFVGCPYEDAEEALHGLGDGETPIILTDERWHVVSPEDAWMLLNGKLAKPDIDKFCEIACEVLITPDALQGLDIAARLNVQINATRTGHTPPGGTVFTSQTGHRDHSRIARMQAADAAGHHIAGAGHRPGCRERNPRNRPWRHQPHDMDSSVGGAATADRSRS